MPFAVLAAILPLVPPAEQDRIVRHAGYATAIAIAIWIACSASIFWGLI